MKKYTNDRRDPIGELLGRAVDDAIVRQHLEEALGMKKCLRVKFGIDPTSPDLHLGHTVPLRKLRAFQELGHQVVLIIGDFTATIGDPSGRNEARQPLKRREIHAHMEDYCAQAALLLDLKKVEVRYNSEWYTKGGIPLLYELFSKTTVQRVLERDDFKKRLDTHEDLSLLEIIYPLLQGYDSVAVKADVEIGGSDQKFNMLMGRKIQRRFGLEEQDIMMTWLIEGTDGSRKMSKTLGNHISLRATPDDMFGKLMSIPDTVVKKYFVALTDMPTKEIDALDDAHPREAKLKLAETIVGMYHGSHAAVDAHSGFIDFFSEGRVPAFLKEVEVKKDARSAAELIAEVGLVKSKAEARRLILQGGVTIDGVRLVDPGAHIEVKSDMVIRAGRRRIVRLK